jgi:hypothetical protein
MRRYGEFDEGDFTDQRKAHTHQTLRVPPILGLDRI